MPKIDGSSIERVLLDNLEATHYPQHLILIHAPLCVGRAFSGHFSSVILDELFRVQDDPCRRWNGQKNTLQTPPRRFIALQHVPVQVQNISENLSSAYLANVVTVQGAFGQGIGELDYPRVHVFQAVLQNLGDGIHCSAHHMISDHTIS